MAVYRLPVTLDDINKIGPNLTFAMLISGQVHPLTPPKARVGAGSDYNKVPMIDIDTESSIRPGKETVRVVIVGDTLTGKTKLLQSYMTGEYSAGYIQGTVFEEYIIRQMINDKPYTLRIHEISGRFGYERLRAACYPGNDVVLVCYKIDCTDWEDSWDQVHQVYFREIKRYCPRVPFILAALRDPEEMASANEAEGMNTTIERNPDHEKLAEKLGAAGYVTCDMGNPEAVKGVFHEVLMAGLREVPISAKKRFWRRSPLQTVAE
ncbi:hypothetical protein DL771_010476 [Monosporascus sp. 5C6A]|nr:hypothetical protein DL771_010476 [Monosporascus sp. 5C6A]